MATLVAVVVKIRGQALLRVRQVAEHGPLARPQFLSFEPRPEALGLRAVETLVPAARRAQAVVLVKFGHTLYYQPTQRCLLWRVVPGQVLLLSSPAQVVAIAELMPVEHVPVSPVEPLALSASGVAPSSPRALPSPPSQPQAPNWGLVRQQAPDRAPDFAPDQALAYAE